MAWFQELETISLHFCYLFTRKRLIAQKRRWCLRTVAHGSFPIYIHLQISPLGHGNQSQIDDLIPQLLKVSSFVMEGSEATRQRPQDRQLARSRNLAVGKLPLGNFDVFQTSKYTSESSESSESSVVPAYSEIH